MRWSTFIMKSRSLDIRGVGGRYSTTQHISGISSDRVLKKKGKGRKFLELLLKDILEFGVPLKGWSLV